MIHAHPATFTDGVVLVLDPETILALHGEIVNAGALRPFRERPNTERLLMILERASVGGDLSEFDQPHLHSVRHDLHP